MKYIRLHSSPFSLEPAQFYPSLSFWSLGFDQLKFLEIVVIGNIVVVLMPRLIEEVRVKRVEKAKD